MQILLKAGNAMKDISYEKYLVRKPLYGERTEARNDTYQGMTILSDHHVPGCGYQIEVGWVHGKPSLFPHSHEIVSDYDQIIIYIGGDYRMPQVLGREVGFYVGGQLITFNTTTVFFIPKGTPYGPVNFKDYRYPNLLINIKCGIGADTETELDSNPAKGNRAPRVKKKDFDYEQYAVRSPLREAGAEFAAGRTSPTLTLMSSLQVPGVKYYIEAGWTFGMPVSRIAGSGMPEMVHRKFNEIVLHIGGDPANPEELGGEVEFYVGGQPLVFNTTSALFIPTGVKHGPLRLLKYEKPHIVMAIMCGAGTIKEGWGDSFKIS